MIPDWLDPATLRWLADDAVRTAHRFEGRRHKHKTTTLKAAMARSRAKRLRAIATRVENKRPSFSRSFIGKPIHGTPPAPAAGGAKMKTPKEMTR